MRVLAVDDDADTADSMVMLLEIWGYAAKACYCGAAALETALTYRPHVVLLDVGMAGMDGFEIARSLRDRPGFAAAVIGISGYGDESNRRRAMACGFDDYLLKPVDPDCLLELLSGVAWEVEWPTPVKAAGAPGPLAWERFTRRIGSPSMQSSPTPLPLLASLRSRAPG
jgi:DNA-binding response OmpR family regulator